jgi:ankyrin repeat protein
MVRRAYVVIAGWVAFFIFCSIFYRYRWVTAHLMFVDPPPQICNDIDVLNTFLRAGGNPNSYMPGKEPMIICATEAENTKVVARLIEAGADINTSIEGLSYPTILPAMNSRIGITALYVAVEKGNLEITQLLVNHGANIQDMARGMTPFELAISKDQKEILTWFFEIQDYPVTVGRGISTAASEGNLGVLEMLTRKGVEISDEDGTALQLAVSEGHLDVVKFLIKNGSPLHGETSSGLTALHIAARENQIDIAKLLIAEGAPVNTKTGRYGGGQTPLDIAIAQNHSEIVDLLRAAGAKPSE